MVSTGIGNFPDRNISRRYATLQSVRGGSQIGHSPSAASRLQTKGANERNVKKYRALNGILRVCA
eukprot:552260-Prymnesium_polylepis.1